MDYDRRRVQKDASPSVEAHLYSVVSTTVFVEYFIREKEEGRKG